MKQPIQGSLGVASTFQLTEKMEGTDKESKNLLMYKEVLAVILKYTVAEYQDYTVAEVMGFIEEDSISDSQEVSRNRTNTRIDGRATEFPELGEKTSYFDLRFLARNPRLSSPSILVNLHIDLEPQKDYHPGYPIEKRGFYYLARDLSSQLDVLTEQTDYGQLEKCISIWICRDNIPREEQMSISFYEIQNARNIGNCNPLRDDYDLMQLIVIRLGESEYQSEEQDVLEFLSAIFYPHGPDFRKKISKYIDLDSCLKKEATDGMFNLNEWFYQDGVETGIEAFILEKLEDHVPEELILKKLQRFFKLSAESAEAYFAKYASAEVR